ncbi:MAG: Crp/Fnr family transcriptional regulator [Chloroflexota bacterium]|nr:Crp/Fnr family transcriptional regulator [Chloroflexota bacterium]
MDSVVGDALANSFLAELPDDLVNQLLVRAPIREVSAGRVFISEHDPHRSGILLSGLVRVYLVRPNGAQVTLRRISTGAALGVRAMVGRRNQASAQAVTDCEFLRLDTELLVTMGRSNAAVGWAIAQELDRRLVDTHLELEGSVQGTVCQKIAAALLDRTVDYEPLDVAITQEELAAIVGASREAVGRELRTLASAGVLTLRRGGIGLRDAVTLQAVARAEPLRTQRMLSRDETARETGVSSLASDG